MNKLDNRVIEFILEHHVLVLATVENNKPYCCDCYYAYNQEKNYFVLKSNIETLHYNQLKTNKNVSASIVLETSEVGKIQGLQICGVVNNDNTELLTEAKKVYLKKFPFAIAMSGEYIVLEPNLLKMTDNRFGFGKKFVWIKDN
ncbi:MAG: pyridoxamine 5'-phosphate oxidase family protein [Bacteroidales bacterium]|nr:pyridoxamine 5'-phosphate oxidase family protein [Bacteroidales bacterium]